jgi:hypothetical protein
VVHYPEAAPSGVLGAIRIITELLNARILAPGERFITPDDVAVSPADQALLYTISARDIDCAFGYVARNSGYTHILVVACGESWGRQFRSTAGDIEPEHPVLVEWVWNGNRTARLHCLTEEDAVLLRLALGGACLG